MDIEQKRKNWQNMDLRVAYYARVSSDSDAQLNSLENQIAFFENKIKSNERWKLVRGYIDEGISGISTKNREEFKRMLADAKSGKFDLLVTKEISRFARNTLDSITYTRELLENGVGVQFLNDSLCTFDGDGELRLTIMASIAQDELRKLSQRVKFGHKQAIKSGVVLGNSRIFGYEKKNKKLIVNEDEAVMVRELFALYATGEYSMKQIEKIFYTKGYRNRNGNKIAHSTMSGIIANQKYKGYYTGHIVEIESMFTKKQRFVPEDERVIYKDESGEIVPAIVDEELWEKANAVLRRRSDDVKNRKGICNHANLLTGKMICSECGSKYYRKETKSKTTGQINSKWVCSGKIENGKDSCSSFAIYENEIKPILYDVFSETLPDVESAIKTYMTLYENMLLSNDTDVEIQEKNNRIDEIDKEKMLLLSYNAKGVITERDYLKQMDILTKEQETLSKEVEELSAKTLSKSDFKKKLDGILSVLKKAKNEARESLVTPAFVNKYIDKIYVTPISTNEAKLEIKIFTGETTEKYINKLNLYDKKCVGAENTDVRTGHMFKKMIESYENGIKNSK